jgi:hypothetical protein
MDTLMQLIERELNTTAGAAETGRRPSLSLTPIGRVWARANVQNAGLLDHALDFLLEESTSRSSTRPPRLVDVTSCAAAGSSAELSPSPTLSASSAETVRPAARGKPRSSSWTDEKRERHRTACKNKSKLSLGEKLDIIRHYAEGYTQAQLAEKYAKSRAAISKILRPENVARLNKVSETGIEPHMRSYSHIIKNLELEKRVHEVSLAASAGGEGRASIKARIIKTEGVSRGWYTRFCKRHSCE